MSNTKQLLFGAAVITAAAAVVSAITLKKRSAAAPAQNPLEGYQPMSVDLRIKGVIQSVIIPVKTTGQSAPTSPQPPTFRVVQRGDVA